MSFIPTPQMQGALANWQRPMTFITTIKELVDFEVVETKTEINFKGVWQPYNSQQLNLKPEGQRAWKWFTCHAETRVQLDPDEIISYNGKDYRVMEKRDYNEYGYIEYHLIEDYEGA
jgi:hypothetical protein